MNVKWGTTCVVAMTMAGCGQAGPPTGGGSDGGAPAVQTVLSGVLPARLRGPGRAIEVVDFEGGVAGPVVCATEASRDGAWSCDLGPLYGAFLVQVDADGVRRRAVVAGVEQGKARTVVLSAFTHLTAAYVEARLADGEALDVALPAARRLMHGHFGMIAHHQVAPAGLTEDLGGALEAPVVAGFLEAGLGALAGEIAEANGQAPGGTIDDNRLITALSGDVRADGVFDGQGAQGALRLGETALDGDTLRADYGRALLDFVRSEANPTGFGEADFASFAQRIADNTSELFPETVPTPLDDTPPTLVAVEVATDPAAPKAPGTPMAGMVFVTVEARDPSGLASFTLTARAGPEVGAGERLGATGWRWALDTTERADGPALLDLVVTDGAGNRAGQAVELVVDNTPPELTVQALGRAASSTIAVRGEVTDAIGPVARLEVAALGAMPVEVLDPERFFSVPVNVPCDGADHTVQVRAEDRAGNAASALVDTGCDDSAPSLQVRPTTYLDGNQVDATYGPNGQTLRYAPVDFPDRTRINTTDAGTIVRYFTRLDETAPDLPTLGVSIADDRGVDQVAVEYRYTVEGALVRDWTTAQTEDRWDWFIPVSYQTLGVELATAGPGAVHRVEVRATDAAGNWTLIAFDFDMALRSPPVWFGGCELHPTLESFSLQSRNLHEVFRGLSTPAQLGQLRYDLGLDPSSLAPRGDVEVRVAQTDLRTFIEGIRLDGHQNPTTQRIRWADAQPWVCPVGEHRVWIGPVGTGLDLGCRPGVFALQGQPWRTRANDGPLNEDFAHQISSFIADVNGASRLAPGGYFLVAPGPQHAVEVRLESPIVRIDGQAYTWPTSLNLPQGFSSNGTPARYRGFSQWAGEGADILQHWLGGANAGMDARRYVLRPYVSEVSFEMQPLQLEVQHSSLDVTVPIEADWSCLTPLVYTTAL